MFELVAIARNPDPKATVRLPAGHRRLNAGQPATQAEAKRVICCRAGVSVIAKLTDGEVADNVDNPRHIPGAIGAQKHYYVGMLVVVVHDFVEIIRIPGERVQQQILGDEILGGRDDFHIGAILVHNPVHPFDIFRERQGAAHDRVLLNRRLQAVQLIEQDRRYKQRVIRELTEGCTSTPGRS